MTSHVVDALKWFFFGLVPPDAPDDWGNNGEVQHYRKQKVRWRRAVAVSMWTLSVVALVLTCTVFGWIPEKLDRPAWAADVKSEVKNQVAPLAKDVELVKGELGGLKQQVANVDLKTNAMLLSQLRSELRETRRLQCQAMTAGDAERKKTYGNLISSLKEQYEAIKGRPWDQPGCDEV